MNHATTPPKRLSRKGNSRIFASLRAASVVGLLAVDPAQGAEPVPQALPSNEHSAIARVLETYRIAVSTANEALFLTTILDTRISFFSAGDAPAENAALTSEQTRAFESFRQAVFHSNKSLSQTFDHIEIRQDRSLAQASLHFVTQLRGTTHGSEGWKTLIFLKVGDQWKIVSEFYTVRPLHQPPADEAGR